MVFNAPCTLSAFIYTVIIVQQHFKRSIYFMILTFNLLLLIVVVLSYDLPLYVCHSCAFLSNCHQGINKVVLNSKKNSFVCVKGSTCADCHSPNTTTTETKQTPPDRCTADQSSEAVLKHTESQKCHINQLQCCELMKHI